MQLQQQMNPQPLEQLQPQPFQQPNYDQAISQILDSLQFTLQNYQSSSLNAEIAGKLVHQFAQSAHFLAQAAQQEGQHIPAAIQMRLTGEKLALQQQQQQQQQDLQQKDQQHQHAMDILTLLQQQQQQQQQNDQQQNQDISG